MMKWISFSGLRACIDYVDRVRLKTPPWIVAVLLIVSAESRAESEPAHFMPVLEDLELPAMEEARVLRGTQIPLPDPNPGGMTLSKHASVRRTMSAVKDQKSRGTCSVFAAVALMEANTGVLLSEQCLAYQMGTGDPGRIIERLQWASGHPLYLSHDCGYDTKDPSRIPDLSSACKWHPRMLVETESFGWFSRKDPIAFIRKNIDHGKPVGGSVIVAGTSWTDLASVPTRLKTGSREPIVIRLPPHMADDYPDNWPPGWPAPNPDGTLTRDTWEYVDFDVMQALRDPQHRDLLRKHWYSENAYPTGKVWDRTGKQMRTRSFEEYFASLRIEAPSAEEVADSCRGESPSSGKKKCGSHAIVFVGYDDETQTLEFKNSWGESWKNEGYGYMSYDYYRRFHVGFSDKMPLISVSSFR